jgi:Zinc carboxypeptidase
MAASKNATIALKGPANGMQFKYGPLCATIYQASGSSVDSMYDLGVKYSFTAELRDDGYFGFVLPAKYIVTSGQEMTRAMIALYSFIINTEGY